MNSVLLNTNFPTLEEPRRGKVRDVYDLDKNLLIVTTDRISAFDCVMPNGIPGKGKVLTEMSLFWFDLIKDIVPNHLITADFAELTRRYLGLKQYAKQLEGRFMLVYKADPIMAECIVRGHITGSGWESYQKNGEICGIDLPKGLLESQKLPKDLFTPSTKAESGHDENINFAELTKLIGVETAKKIHDFSLAVYEKARIHAADKGIIIADTKFEFGIVDEKIILIDEVLTPDSSRFWPADEYEPGRSQKSFDKQYVRDYLKGLDWDKTPPAPELPDEIVTKTAEKYQQALQMLVE